MTFSYDVLLIIISLLVFAYLVYLVGRQRKSFEDKLVSTGKGFEDYKSSIQDIIYKQIKIKVRTYRSEEAVIDKAARVIKKTIEGIDDENLGDNRIIFYGSATLATSADSSSQEVVSASEKYSEALQMASQKSIKISRYISLMTINIFKIRSEEIRKEYMDWLNKQIAFLSSDHNYELYDVIRAPQWGGNVAQIITPNEIMMIAGNGKAAIVVEDPEAVDVLTENAKKGIFNTHASNPPILYSYHSNSIDKLRKKAEELKKIV